MKQFLLKKEEGGGSSYKYLYCIILIFFNDDVMKVMIMMHRVNIYGQTRLDLQTEATQLLSSASFTKKIIK